MFLRYLRIKWLVGEDNFARLCKARVLVCGLGGVGGVCADSLFRSGFSKLTLIDKDSFLLSNQNRQILSEHLDEKKAEVFAKYYQVEGLCANINEDFLQGFSLDDFDIIIDAIDDIQAKIALLKYADTSKQIYLSSCGAAKRTDPSKIKVADIFKTHSDPLARKFRYELKKAKLKPSFDVVFSTEQPKCEKLGSFMGVTASFGHMLASLAFRKYLKLA